MKSCVENDSKGSKNKLINANARSGDTYTCRNCLKDGYNARSYTAPCKFWKCGQGKFLFFFHFRISRIYNVYSNVLILIKI